MPDPFGTERIRAGVLQTWTTTPNRLREDANAEEDHARRYYRDRVVVELAQNAADAAVRLGIAGRLLLRLEVGDVPRLIAANTGAPLDAAGVASLAALRASAKTGAGLDIAGIAPAPAAPTPPHVVGRFGVGFAAVRSVSDEVEVRSTTGAIQFSLARTREALAALAPQHPELAAVVADRSGALPALRLPWPIAAALPTGYETAVVLELRDDAAVAAVEEQLAAVDDALLLALPGLAEVEVELPGARRRVADVAERWVSSSAHGTVDPALLADRPVEERDPRWRVTWAVPRDPGRNLPDLITHAGVVHAPTPTDEPSTTPALLIATLPLDPTRRHAAPGPVTEHIAGAAGQAYPDLVLAAVRAGGEPLRLVPTGPPAGALDAAIRSAALEALAQAAVLRTVTGEAVAPRDAVALAGTAGADTELLRALSRWAGALVPLTPGEGAAARAVGVAIRSLADLLDELPATGSPVDLARLYAALGPYITEPAVREAANALPVPLVIGRFSRGVRGLVLPPPDLTQPRTVVGELAEPEPTAPAALADPEHTGLAALADWGVRVVHPDAAHPLLERLGAVAPRAADLLTLPGVRDAVHALADDDEPDGVAIDAVLSLVQAAVADSEAETIAASAPWLGDLPLPGVSGDLPARDLLLPGSWAEQVLDPQIVEPVAPDVIRRWGPEVLTAVGVRSGLRVVQVPDVLVGDTDHSPLADELADWDDYLDTLAEQLGDGAYLGQVTGVADLDAVRDEAWPDVLHAIAADPAARAALLEPVRAEGAPGASATSYAAWWLRTHLGLDRPFALAGSALTDVLPPAPSVLADLDEQVHRALSGIGDWPELDGAGWLAVLDGLPGTWAAVLPVWRGLAQAAARGLVLDPPPDRVPAMLAPDQVAVVDAAEAAVPDAPMWQQRTDVAALVPAPDGAVLADLLDLPLTSELVPGAVDQEPAGAGAGPQRQPVPAEVTVVLPGAPGTWVEHEDLTVDGVPIDWWVAGAGADATVHAVHLAGLARGLAQAAGRWDLRHAVELVLLDPHRAADLRLEAAYDRMQPGAGVPRPADEGLPR